MKVVFLIEVYNEDIHIYTKGQYIIITSERHLITIEKSSFLGPNNWLLGDIFISGVNIISEIYFKNAWRCGMEWIVCSCKFITKERFYNWMIRWSPAPTDHASNFPKYTFRESEQFFINSQSSLAVRFNSIPEERIRIGTEPVQCRTKWPALQFKSFENI